MTLKTLIKISRPHFWLYTAGSYWVGVIAGVTVWQQALNVEIFLYLLFFLIVANVFIYGVNDLYDAETDALNPKKDTKEYRLLPQDYKWLLNITLVCLGISLIFILLAPNLPVLIWMVIFMFLSWAYSATPFRFKARPFWDFAVQFLYVIPGFVAYAQFTGQFPPVWVFVAAWCWTGAMHLFSAIPDIEADAAAKIKTTAVAIGKNKSLLLCAVLWLGAVLATVFGDFYWPYTLLGLIYVIIPLVLLNKSSVKISKVYWYFPYINAAFGFVLYWAIALSKPYA